MVLLFQVEAGDHQASNRHRPTERQQLETDEGSPSSTPRRIVGGIRKARTTRHHHCRTTTSSSAHRCRRDDWKRFVLGAVLILCVLYLSVLQNNSEISLSGSIRSKQNVHKDSTSTERALYTCPATVVKTKQGQDKLTAWYDKVSQQILAGNTTEFWKAFRHTEFDNWGHSYTEIKQGMFEWKSRHYLDLKSDSRIYESACGIGLNLFMTLEILEEVTNHRVENVEIYGNEYVDESVQIFRELFPPGSTGRWPGNARTGTVCTGDSSSLEFVPSNSMDLVFTGYITPHMDPLHLGPNTDDNYARLAELCEAPEDDRESQKLKRLAVVRQEDWYASWVTEMVRIAKPGAPVIVEQVSYPYCEAYFDWDGVAEDFWTRGIAKYGWDIDPKSVVMDRDKIFRRRYHVFMRKLG